MPDWSLSWDIRDIWKPKGVALMFSTSAKVKVNTCQLELEHVKHEVIVTTRPVPSAFVYTPFVVPLGGIFEYAPTLMCLETYPPQIVKMEPQPLAWNPEAACLKKALVQQPCLFRTWFCPLKACHWATACKQKPTPPKPSIDTQL